MIKIKLFTKENEKCESIKKSLYLLLSADKEIAFADNDPNLVITIGGDGTFLKAVHQYINVSDDIVFFPINAGNLGFFSDYKCDELEDIVYAIKNNAYRVGEYRLLEAEIDSQGCKKTIYGVNEIRVENPFHTLKTNVVINGEELESFRGNGLVVSTALGSSAYNKSLGGALVDTSMPIFELTEIAPINNSSCRSLGSSIVLNRDAKIDFKFKNDFIVVGHDHLNFNIESVDKITFRLSNKKVNIVHRKNRTYIQKLKESFIK